MDINLPITENGTNFVTVRFAVENENGKRFNIGDGTVRAFLIKTENGRINFNGTVHGQQNKRKTFLIFGTVQIALFLKKRKTVR